MTDSFSESTVEAAALAWLESLGYGAVPGLQIAPGEPAAERADYSAVVLERRLKDALAQLNPDLPAGALEDGYRRLTPAALRHALLPKITSGEVRIKNAERFIRRESL